MARQLLRFEIHSKSILKVLKDYENAPQLIDSGARKDGDRSHGRWTNQQKFILILLEYSLLMYYDMLELKMERFNYLILVCGFFGIHRNYQQINYETNLLRAELIPEELYPLIIELRNSHRNREIIQRLGVRTTSDCINAVIRKYNRKLKRDKASASRMNSDPAVSQIDEPALSPVSDDENTSVDCQSDCTSIGSLQPDIGAMNYNNLLSTQQYNSQLFDDMSIGSLQPDNNLIDYQSGYTSIDSQEDNVTINDHNSSCDYQQSGYTTIGYLEPTNNFVNDDGQFFGQQLGFTYDPIPLPIFDENASILQEDEDTNPQENLYPFLPNTQDYDIYEDIEDSSNFMRDH